MLSLSQLVTPVTEDEAIATALKVLSDLGFNATSWQPVSAQLIFIRFFCRIYSRVTNVISDAAAGGFTTLAADLAEASWLRLLAKHFYSIEYLRAQSTVGKFLLTSSAAAPSLTFAAGDLIVADAATGTDGAHSYTCTEGGTLAPGSTLLVEFKADVSGADSNIAPDTTLFLWTPIVGITVTNAALLPDSNTWITTPGSNDESNQRLLTRCIARWARLSYGSVEGAYVGWALEALPALERVTVKAAAGDLRVTIIGATALGALSGPQCTTITNYVNGVSDGIGRRPINDIVSTESAVVQTSPALTITAYMSDPREADATPGRVETALLAYFGRVPIGGSKLVSLTQGYVLYDAIVGLSKTKGVKSVVVSVSDNIPLAYNEIYEPTITVNTVNVTPGSP